MYFKYQEHKEEVFASTVIQSVLRMNSMTKQLQRKRIAAIKIQVRTTSYLCFFSLFFDLNEVCGLRFFFVGGNSHVLRQKTEEEAIV